jgi:hypothetical protein
MCPNQQPVHSLHPRRVAQVLKLKYRYSVVDDIDNLTHDRVAHSR